MKLETKVSVIPQSIFNNASLNPSEEPIINATNLHLC